MKGKLRRKFQRVLQLLIYKSVEKSQLWGQLDNLPNYGEYRGWGLCKSPHEYLASSEMLHILKIYICTLNICTYLYNWGSFKFHREIHTYCPWTDPNTFGLGSANSLSQSAFTGRVKKVWFLGKIQEIHDKFTKF